MRGCSSQSEERTTCCWSLHVDSRPLACRLPGVDGGGTLNSTIEQVQPKHPELRTSHRFASICTGKEKFIIDAVQQHLQLRCCIMSSGRTGWRSACFCRDGDTLAFWIPQTWHVHVAVLPRRHRCHRHQGYGKGSRSMRVESSRILGESSCCNSAATSLIQSESSLETIIDYGCYSKPPTIPIYGITSLNLQDQQSQPPGILRIRQPPSWSHTSRTTSKTKPWATSTPASPPPAPWLATRWAASEDLLKMVVAQ
jgi:hypothetical protein